jgi:cytochrome c
MRLLYISALLIVTYAFSSNSLVYAQGIPSIVKNNNCVTCHSNNKSLMGPSWQDISKKYKNDANAKDIISSSISNGTSGKWSAVPMPANPQLKKDEVDAISKWILQQ